MDEETYRKLVEVISNYYPITDMDKNQINGIVSDKIKALDDPSPFKSLCKGLEDSGYFVEDISYAQFPNLKLYLEEIENVSDYMIYKNFAINISLLCPHYTFFYEYEFRIKTENGFLPLSKVCFLDEAKFTIIKRKTDVDAIEAQIQTQFPRHSYINHYHLLVNKVDFGHPLGEFVEKGEGYSIFRYLFDSTSFTQEYA